MATVREPLLPADIDLNLLVPDQEPSIDILPAMKLASAENSPPVLRRIAGLPIFHIVSTCYWPRP
jgi:hypothetical protein